MNDPFITESQMRKFLKDRLAGWEAELLSLILDQVNKSIKGYEEKNNKRYDEVFSVVNENCDNYNHFALDFDKRMHGFEGKQEAFYQKAKEANDNAKKAREETFPKIDDLEKRVRALEAFKVKMETKKENKDSNFGKRITIINVFIAVLSAGVSIALKFI